MEISGRFLNVYGQGALRFIDRPWNPVKAGDVTNVRFNYVNFNSLSCVLGRLKQRYSTLVYIIPTQGKINQVWTVNLCMTKFEKKLSRYGNDGSRLFHPDCNTFLTPSKLLVVERYS